MSRLHGFVDFCRGHLRLLLLAVGLLTLAAGYIASGLTIDSNLQRLLPTQAPSVKSLERLEQSYQGALGRLTILLESEDAQQMVSASGGLADQLAQLEDVDRVEYRRPSTFFKQFRLLYADSRDLRTVQQRLKRRIRWEKRRANPLYIELEDEPPEIDISDIISRYPQAAGSDYYVSEAGDRLAIFIYPTFPAKELARSRQLVERVQTSVSDYLDSKAPEVSFELTGRYKKRVDLQQLLASDLTTAMIVASIGLTAFLLLLTRSLTGLALILLPLATGTIWTFGWAEIAFESLNLLTAFLGAILLGLGVDYGIHLHFRYFEAHRSKPPDEALVEAFRHAGRANLYAGLTTIVPLASLLISGFQAFYEFGVIAIGGILLILAAYAVIFPCLVFFFAERGISPHEPLAADLVAFLTPRLLAAERRRSQAPEHIIRWALFALGLLAIPALYGATVLEFNRDFHVLQSTQARSWQLDERVNEIIGRSQTPAVVLTDSPTHTAQVIEELRRRAEEAPGGYTIDEIVALESLVPDQQSTKLKRLRQLDRELEALPQSAVQKSNLADYAEELDRIVEHGRLDLSDFPESLTAPFQRTDEGSVILVFPAVDLTATDKFEDFVDVLRDLPEIDYETGYDTISEALLLYDIVRYVERDATRQVLLTLAGLLLISLLSLRAWRDSLLQFGILLASLGVAVGWVGLLGVAFNFLNIIVVPIWLGLGIDATFHVIFNMREHPTWLAAHLTTGLAIAAAFLTTILGFGAMLLAHHRGLYSLGEISVVGLTMLMLTNLLVYIYLVSRARPTEDKAPGADPEPNETSQAGEFDDDEEVS